jgi:HAD superfamily hydrolase (TIGR01509 family)
MTKPGDSINTLLFDWDGTLNDSAASGFTAFEKSLAELGVRFTLEFYEANYTPNWYRMYEVLNLPPEEWERADQLWLHHYGDAPVTLVEGARETLRELERRGYRLGIVTSGSQARIARELDQTGLGGAFRAVVCNEHIVNKKPHPEGLEHAMRLMKAEPSACSYVGDAPDDILMGKSAQVLTVGVKSFYPSSKHLAGASPDIHLNSITELLLHFDGI